MTWVDETTDSDEKVRLLAFFRKNPGVIETTEGLARRLALPRQRLENQVQDILPTGLLLERRVGNHAVITVNRERLEAMATMIEGMLARKAEEAAKRRRRS